MDSDHTYIALFSSGYCTAKKYYVIPGDPSETIPFHATWAYIDHPVLGKTLFDTGYSSRFYHATKTFPNRIYRFVTPVFHQDRMSCLNQLPANKIDPDSIQNIVISHFHADHIGGLMDFPKATYWCSRAALDFVSARNKYTAVFYGLLKSMIPEDLSIRTTFPEDLPGKTVISGLTMWPWHDDFYFVNLPGHFRGQLGVYLKHTNIGDVLLCADAAWSSQSIIQRIYPSRMVSLISDDYSVLKQTIDYLHQFHKDYPEVLILPSHCQETFKMTQQYDEV
jgi:glyoxylase-like metal-dependent hydrolase (beta-lactamase superfamily II)